MPASYLPERLFKNPAFVDEVAIAPHGFVKLVRVDGDDDFIALSARHGKESDNPTPKLIRYMIRHRHTTPFETVGFVFHLKMPIFVARQWMRHRMGTFNELSGRYEEMRSDFWMPKDARWRKQAEGNHQGSSREKIDVDHLNFRDTEGQQLWAEDAAIDEYRSRIDSGVAREQARSCLPLSTYTEMFWKVDLHNLFHFLKLRLDPHAQQEIREFAQAVEGFVRQAFPIAYSAWVDCVRDAVTLTVQDQQALAQFLQNGDGSTIAVQEMQEIVDEVPDAFPSKREGQEFVEKLKKVARSFEGRAMDESDPAYFPGNQDGDA